MQFQIPQFIEIEDKIAGPFSLRQLLFVVGGGIITFLAFTMLPFFAALLIGLIALGGSLALALVKVNGQPLPRIAFAAAGFFWKPRLYLWKREMKERTYEMPEFAGLKNIPAPEEPAIEQYGEPIKTVAAPVETQKRVAPAHDEAPVAAHEAIPESLVRNYGEVREQQPIASHLEASERESMIRQRALERSVEIERSIAEEAAKQQQPAKGKGATRRVVSEAVSEQHIMDQRDTLKKFTAHMPLVNKLSLDLNTTKNPIPQREKSIPAVVAEKFNIIRKSTGERQMAKRVDFR
jgi:hypothetical protein